MPKINKVIKHAALIQQLHHDKSLKRFIVINVCSKATKALQVLRTSAAHEMCDWFVATFQFYRDEPTVHRMNEDLQGNFQAVVLQVGWPSVKK